MKRQLGKVHRDGWATAQAPRLVSGQQLPDELAMPAVKSRQAERLRAEVEAHIQGGGTYLVITTPTASTRRGRA
ncbi:hypothetical protein [Pseudoxanthomonas wuyuanensis]|uniref:Uncharacterized protein n=1 Tax=Pseudoxanthomonas wuyuanensis TaxID=1073196 RepID=A0A286D4P5_9GAMM|nr:hypothetical protein [Pseudoxanthomonas wuyuanensis]KAF1719786.1 hypothetical protein CSC75_13950 [Pseudoxanthomonas wuyuanensis]SOD53627.1 hypothetical protein SAMN06296416_102507 [Pseudoxanthomonas wuyuanensis]